MLTGTIHSSFINRFSNFALSAADANHWWRRYLLVAFRLCDYSFVASRDYERACCCLYLNKRLYVDTLAPIKKWFVEKRNNSLSSKNISFIEGMLFIRSESAMQIRIYGARRLARTYFTLQRKSSSVYFEYFITKIHGPSQQSCIVHARINRRE
jgi:hypothetical protein